MSEEKDTPQENTTESKKKTTRRRQTRPRREEWEKKLQEAEAAEVSELLQIAPPALKAQLYYWIDDRDAQPAFVKTIEIKTILDNAPDLESYLQRVSGGKWLIKFAGGKGQYLTQKTFSIAGPVGDEIKQLFPEKFSPGMGAHQFGKFSTSVLTSNQQPHTQLAELAELVERLKDENRDLRHTLEMRDMMDEIEQRIPQSNSLNELIVAITQAVTPLLTAMLERKPSNPASDLMPIVVDLIKNVGGGSAKELREIMKVAQELPSLVPGSGMPIVKKDDNADDLIGGLIKQISPLLTNIGEMSGGGNVASAPTVNRRPTQQPTTSQTESESEQNFRKFREMLDNRQDPATVANFLRNAIETAKSEGLATVYPALNRINNDSNAFDSFVARFPELEGARGQDYKDAIKEQFYGHG